MSAGIRRTRLSGVIVLTLALGACTSNASGTADMPVTTSTSTATTSPRPVDRLVLRRDGLGAVAFDAPVDDVITALSAVFAAPVRDQTVHFENGTPVFPPGVTNMTVFTTFFDQTVGRSVCWDVPALCVVFGGETGNGLVFRGWVLTSGGLTMSNGLGVGNHVSDFPAMAVARWSAQACDTAYRVFDGVGVSVRATGEPFAEGVVDADGITQQVDHTPDPATVEIVGLDAGYRGEFDTEVCTT